MIAFADTHIALWFLWAPHKLSSKAVAAIESSERQGKRIGLSTMSLCEVIYLVERGRIDPLSYESLLEGTRSEDGLFEEVPLTRDICAAMRVAPCTAIPELPDRVIAASAMSCGVPLITRDRAIRASGVPVLW